jgi:hypothetical protein
MRKTTMFIAAIVSVFLMACGAPDPMQSSPVSGSGTTSSRSTGVGSTTASPQSTLNSAADQCTFTSGTAAEISDLDHLTWASERIVVGEVAKIYPSVPDPQARQQPLYTEFDVAVEQSLRGHAIDTLRIRRGGGEIPGGCSDPQGVAPVHIGDRFIFFLGYQVEQASVPTYFLIGEQQGLWKLNGDAVADVLPWYSEFTSQAITDVATHIESSLAAAPPERPIAGFIPVVTLDQAPPGPDLPSSATPVP